MKDEHVARFLEIGVGLFGALVSIGGVVLLLGRVIGDIVRRVRYSESPPGPGSVPDERHEHVATSSPR